jgi:hypothetical protein
MHGDPELKIFSIVGSLDGYCDHRVQNCVGKYIDWEPFQCREVDHFESAMNPEQLVFKNEVVDLSMNRLLMEDE